MLLEPMIPTLRAISPARKTADNAEIVIHCLPRGEIREHPPPHSGLHDVQDAAENRKQRIFPESFFGV